MNMEQPETENTPTSSVFAKKGNMMMQSSSKINYINDHPFKKSETCIDVHNHYMDGRVYKKRDEYSSTMNCYEFEQQEQAELDPYRLEIYQSGNGKQLENPLYLPTAEARR